MLFVGPERVDEVWEEIATHTLLGNETDGKTCIAAVESERYIKIDRLAYREKEMING